MRAMWTPEGHVVSLAEVSRGPYYYKEGKWCQDVTTTKWT